MNYEGRKSKIIKASQLMRIFIVAEFASKNEASIYEVESFSLFEN